jgi:peptidyl-prolyl cis-trans isomerase SurA
MLSRNGVHMSTLRSQFASQIAWSKTVQQEYGDRIDVGSAAVDAEVQRLAESKNKTHFYVAEIFQSVDNPEDEAKVKKSMDDLEVQLRSGAPFPTVARQFSQNPTAASGGDLGLVVEGQLPKELNDALLNMRPGVVSDPIKSAGGYYILYLRQRQEPANSKLTDTPAPKVDEHPSSMPLARLLFPVGAKPAKDLVTRVMDFAGQIRTHIDSCARLPDIAKQIKGVVYMNLGTMHVTDLSPEIQSALAQTQSGETTLPFQDAAGIELIVRCDAKAAPKTTAFQMPSRDDVEEQLFEERLGVLSRQYLRDLRRNAEIQLPGDGLFARHRKDDSDTDATQ